MDECRYCGGSKRIVFGRCASSVPAKIVNCPLCGTTPKRPRTTLSEEERELLKDMADELIDD